MEQGLFTLIAFALIFVIGSYLYVRYTDRKSEEKPTETQQWRQAFDALISRVQARTSQFSSEEVEADITAAANEVKELRRAHHRRD
jgi:soluble cytochrome b562